MSDNTIAMHTGRKLKVSTGETVNSNVVVNRETNWPKFVTKLQQVVITGETYTEYQAMLNSQSKKVRAEAAKIKDVGYYVGGHFKDGLRNNRNILSRDIISLDADHCPPKFTDIVKQKIGSYTYVLHSTHGHCDEEPRLRILFPLTKSIPPEQYAPISRMLASKIGIEYFDNTTDQPARAMFWPSVPFDSDYVFEDNEGTWVDPADLLDNYIDWRDMGEWPYAERHEAQAYEKKAKAQDPREKSGLIGAFCRVYDIHSAIYDFIPDAYLESGPDRYTYTGSSTSNGAVVYDGGLFLFSNHETDPCSGVNVNAFDMVRLHKFGELDKECKDRTPTNKLKSYKAMLEFIGQDQDTRVEYSRELTEGFECEEENAETESEDIAWRAKLELGDKGRYLSTLENIRIILQNDNIAKSISFNKLRYDFVRSAHAPWAPCEDSVNGDNWTDHDDACLRDYIESKFGLKVSKANAFDAMNVIRNGCAFHPVLDYLEELEWDGVSRLDPLLTDHLGVEDNLYTRTISRKFFCGAVARIYDPGCHFDYCLILEGGQGIGKSTFVRTLVGNHKWFLDDVSSLKGKEVVESLMGQWIIELSELQAFNKSDIEHIKGFLSRREDKARLAYDRRPTYYKRQNVFIGTTNDSKYLKDDTGNRRFWPVKCSDAKVDFGHLASERDQIWAEAVYVYKKGEKLFIDDPEIEKMVKQQQDERYEEDGWVGLIRDWLDQPQRDVFESPEPEKVRDRVCSAMIYTECLGGSKEKLSRAVSNRITRCMSRVEGWDAYPRTMSVPGYGKPRGWKKRGTY